MMTRFIVLLLALSYSAASLGDELYDIYYKKALVFVKDNPIIASPVTEVDLIELWQRIDGLGNLVSLYAENKDVFISKGAIKTWEVHRRVDVHRRSPMIGYDDETATALARLIKTHAYFAAERLAGRVTASQYNEIKSASTTIGRPLAYQLQAKYSPNKSIIREAQNLRW